MRYEQTPEHGFRQILEAKMGPVTALDFTEQLMIFEGCGMIYGNSNFVQASEVRYLNFAFRVPEAIADLPAASWAETHYMGGVC